MGRSDEEYLGEHATPDDLEMNRRMKARKEVQDEEMNALVCVNGLWIHLKYGVNVGKCPIIFR